MCTQVLQKIDVVEALRIENHQKLRTFKVTFYFLPHDRYCDDKLLLPQQILHYMETRCVCVCVCKGFLYLLYENPLRNITRANILPPVFFFFFLAGFSVSSLKPLRSAVPSWPPSLWRRERPLPEIKTRMVMEQLTQQRFLFFFFIGLSSIEYSLEHF